MNCSLTRKNGKWLCKGEIEGERLTGYGDTPSESLNDLEMKMLGLEHLFFVHMDIDLTEE